MDKCKKCKSFESFQRYKVIHRYSDSIISTNDQDQQSCISSQENLEKFILLLPKLSLAVNACQKASNASTIDQTAKCNVKNSNSVNPNISEDSLTKERAKKFKKNVNKLILFSLSVLNKGIYSVDITEYIDTCDNVKKYAEEHRAKNILEHDGTPDCLKCKLKELKNRIKEIVDITRAIDKKVSEPSVVSSKTSNLSGKSILDPEEKKYSSETRQKKLKKQLKRIEKYAKLYKNEGAPSSQIDTFIKSCQLFKSQIEETEEKQITSQKQSSDGKCVIPITSSDISISCCSQNNPNVEKKVRVDPIKSATPTTITTEDSLSKLVAQINETIKLSKNAKEAGLISNSVDNLITACVETKKCEIPKFPNEQSVLLKELSRKIDNVIKMIKQCQIEGLISKSLQSFHNNLKAAKEKIDTVGKTDKGYERCCDNITRFPRDDTWTIKCNCNPSFCSGMESSKTSVLEKIKACKGSTIVPSDAIIKSPVPESKPIVNCLPNMHNQQQQNVPSEPFNSCSENCCKTVSKNGQSSIICSGEDTKSQPLKPIKQVKSDTTETIKEKSVTTYKDYEFLQPIPSFPSPIQQTKSMSDKTELIESTSVGKDDSCLGYFETKIRKVTKIKRSLNSDGTIREEKETVTSKTSTHDPNKIKMTDDESEDCVGKSIVTTKVNDTNIKNKL